MTDDLERKGKRSWLESQLSGPDLISGVNMSISGSY